MGNASSDFDMMTLLKKYKMTSNRFNRDNVVEKNIINYFKKNPENLKSLNAAYRSQDKAKIARELEECIKTVRAGDDVKYRTYLAICYILNHSEDPLLENINIQEPPVSKLHRQEMLLKDLLEGGAYLEDSSEKYFVNERSLIEDIKQMKSGQGLLQEYLYYLPDTGEKIGLNISLEKKQISSLAKAHPLKLLLTVKEMYWLIHILGEYADSNKKGSEHAERISGEIMRNAAGLLMDLMEKHDLKINMTGLNERISFLKDTFIVRDINRHFDWRRHTVHIEFFENDRIIKTTGKLLDVEGEYINFLDENMEEKQIPISDILEIIKKSD